MNIYSGQRVALKRISFTRAPPQGQTGRPEPLPPERRALMERLLNKDIKDGTLSSPRLRFEFSDIKPVSSAFGRMAEHQEFDFSEMAIVTFIQALALEEPVVLLPAVMLNRFHHNSIICNTESPISGPSDLAGKRIGVRAYTQTTGVWVRGIYHSEYGLDLDGITNVTTEGGHLSAYVEPKNVVRAPHGKKLQQMLRDGEIDAWIAGRDAPAGSEFRPVLPDADAAALEWFERVKAFPINHMVILSRSVWRTALPERV